MSYHLNRLLDIMARLRDPERGCPWDVEQTFRTIIPYTIEEAYELGEAIEAGNNADIQGELGDLLLQIVFHARIGEEAGAFDFDAVCQGICEKMIRRHPHVFGDAAPVIDSDAQTSAWENHKAKERESSRTKRRRANQQSPQRRPKPPIRSLPVSARSDTCGKASK